MLLVRDPKAAKPQESPGTTPKYSVVVPLNETEYRLAGAAARAQKQTIEEWIADMVYT
jgi:hypothetical protein